MSNQRILPNRVVTWLEALLAVFRGHSCGQSTVEYVSIVGTCAIVGLTAFNGYGDAVHNDLRLTGEHLEGRGMPNLVDPLEALPRALADDDDNDDGHDGGEQPGDSADADDDEDDEVEEEERICGVTDTYGKLTRNPLPNRADDAYSLDGTLTGRKYKHKYERDHIPGKHALKIRARALAEDRIAQGLLARCPGLRPDDLERLQKGAFGSLDFDAAGKAIDDAGLTVIMPTEMHKKWSRTQGNKSKRTAPGDANDLARAEGEDIEAYRRFLEEYLAKEGSVQDDDDTQSSDERCAEQILAALDSFPSPRPGEDYADFFARRNAEYDRMLNDTVDGALGPSAVSDAVAAAPLPEYCGDGG